MNLTDPTFYNRDTILIPLTKCVCVRIDRQQTNSSNMAWSGDISAVRLGAWVGQWLGHWPLVQRVRVRFPDRLARSDINFSGLYVRRGWFTGIHLVLGPTTWVHILPVPLNSIV